MSCASFGKPETANASVEEAFAEFSEVFVALTVVFELVSCDVPVAAAFVVAAAAVVGATTLPPLESLGRLCAATGEASKIKEQSRGIERR